jgi:leucyl aminopeptidase (aminopeptidase T)
LTDAQRKTFEARAIKDKERYDAEVAQFRADHPGEPLTIKKKKRIVKLKGPKNARSAYVFYTKEHRQTIQTQNPDSDFGTITKMIADSWNALNAAQKVKFDKLAEADRVRFEAENKAFNQEHPEVKRRKVRAKKGAPKKPRSAYLFYTMEKRASFKAANPEMDFGALTKLVADDWGKLSAAQKKKFEKLAEDDKARHADELKNYVAPTDEELDAAEPVHKKKRVGPKRPRSAYLFFTVAERPKVMAEDASLKFGDVTKKIAETWNALSAREKSKFEDQAKADQERYNLECEAAAAQ